MSKSKTPIPELSDEEEAEIQAEIASDPDNPELTEAIEEMRSAADEVRAELAGERATFVVNRGTREDRRVGCISRQQHHRVGGASPKQRVRPPVLVGHGVFSGAKRPARHGGAGNGRSGFR